MNKLFCSTGTLVGKANGYNYSFIEKKSYTLSNEAQIICLYDSDYDVDEDFTYDLYLNPIKYELDETITFLHNQLNKMNLKGYHFNGLWYLLSKRKTRQK